MDLSLNSIGGLERFRASEAFLRLKPEERNFLDRYSVKVLSKPITTEDLIEISEIDDPSLGRTYKGAGEVQFAIQQLYTTGIEIDFFMLGRPYLFFHSPQSQEFFYFRTNHGDSIGAEETLEVLEIASGEWKRVTDLKLFTGTLGDEDEPNYDGLIKAHDLVVQFNRDQAAQESAMNEIDCYHEEETVTSQERGQAYYHEEQTSGFCQLHAANAFIGYRAVVPSTLQKFIDIKTESFSQAHIEGLAQGGAVAISRGLMSIEDGIDMGMVIDYLRNLSDIGELRLDEDINEIIVGKITLNANQQLVIIDDRTDQEIVVDEAFLALKSRIMVGTFAPVHSQTLRKNDDNSWTVVDSLHASQEVVDDFVGFFRKMLNTQKDIMGTTSLPFAIL